MTKRFLPVVAVALLCLSPVLVCAEDDAPAAAPAPGAPMTLEQAMQGMEHSMKGLKAQLADPTKNDASLAQLAEFERFALAAKVLVPAKIAALQGDEQAKALKEYRGLLVAVVQNALTIEQDVLTGENQAAADAMANFRPLEKQGHMEFRPHK